MNFAALSIVLILAGALLFGMPLGGIVLVKHLSSALSVVSIISAAILVRLNRGVPTVDWKSVDGDAIRRLLDRIDEIARSYMVTLALALLSIAVLVITVAISESAFPYKGTALRIASSFFGASFGLLLSRTAYIVWLDLDIIRLQRAVILSASDSEEVKKQKALADEKLAAMANARITTL